MGILCGDGSTATFNSITNTIHYEICLVFLGPYTGRSPDIIQKLRGVMTNPNCEYGANFVAIHSLAAWSKERGLMAIITSQIS